LSPRKKSPIRPTESKIRIIGGTWRGRKLPVPSQEGLRPTGDRMRETLFNWLAPHLNGARCLDAFAGTGALGLEALSRGATFAQFVEFTSSAASQLKANLALLGCNSASVIQGDFLTQRLNCDPFDIIFIDPPFDMNAWDRSFETLTTRNLLSKHALIYAESPRGQTLSPPNDWSIHKEKSSGQVTARLFQRNTAEYS